MSRRTVLRDVEALSSAGVPIYTDRGRYGGISLLPGFRTELTGLTHNEALALFVAGSRRGAQPFGAGLALASAMLKLVDALPSGHQDIAAAVAQRLLIEPETDLLARRATVDDDTDPASIEEVRRAVLRGHKLRLRYATSAQQTDSDHDPPWRVVDPIGLVTIRGRGYLLATRGGEDRTYRLSRITDSEQKLELADRDDEVDLASVWRDRSTQFRAGEDQVTVILRIAPERRDDLALTALAFVSEHVETDGHLRLEAVFQDARHAQWALWQLEPQAEALEPPWLRAALLARAGTMAARYNKQSS